MKWYQYSRKIFIVFSYLDWWAWLALDLHQILKQKQIKHFRNINSSPMYRRQSSNIKTSLPWPRSNLSYLPTNPILSLNPCNPSLSPELNHAFATGRANRVGHPPTLASGGPLLPSDSGPIDLWPSGIAATCPCGTQLPASDRDASPSWRVPRAPRRRAQVGARTRDALALACSPSPISPSAPCTSLSW